MQTELPEINPPAGKALKILTGILIVMFPVGFIIMFTPFGAEYLWTTTIFLGLQAIITFLILSKLADLLSVVITTAVIFMASWFIEYWGVTTGFPFGIYSYSHTLAPLIGGVPLAIMFAWFTVTANSLLAARFFLKGYSEVSAILIASIFVLATDILLEPFASFINSFWIWETAFIPIQNFISWFLIGLIFVITLSQLVKWHNVEINNSQLFKIPLLITAINIINFSVINIANGYYFLTITGMVILTVTIASIKFFKPVK
ncbi:MAG: carotenoid biosynthesis protein [Ignavibacteria bacterium]